MTASRTTDGHQLLVVSIGLSDNPSSAQTVANEVFPIPKSAKIKSTKERDCHYFVLTADETAGTRAKSTTGSR